MIPFIDFGGSGPLLHFAHANGYPPEGYTPFLENFTPRYHVISMITRAQWSASQPQELGSWDPFVVDLIRFLDEQGGRPVFGVGHSLGAVVTLAAALQRPELFKAIVLIEPVLFRRRMLFVIDIFRRLGILRLVHPLIPKALRRRRIFANPDEMYARYRQAPIFNRIADRGLQAYVASLARPRPDGQVELAFSPEWEAQIYETGPLNLWEGLKDLKSPLLVIRGAESDTFSPAAAQKVRRALPDAVIHNVPQTGHLIPMEKPGEVASLIHDFFTRAVPDTP